MVKLKTGRIGFFVIAVCMILLPLRNILAGEMPPARISGIARDGEGDDDVEEYLGDALIPLTGDEDRLAFFNIRVLDAGGTVNDRDYNEEEINLGVGYRYVVPKHDVIMGVNVFYDQRWTVHDTYIEQYGGGVELLSERFDLRFNIYDPEEQVQRFDSVLEVEREKEESVSYGPQQEVDGCIQRERTVSTRIIETTRLREHIEEPMPGYDFEVGTKVPHLPDWLNTRLYVGMYYFESDIGEDLEGYRWRAEWRPVRAIRIDAEFYEDQELNDAEYFVSGRLSVPFNIGKLVQLENPFEQIDEYFTPRPFRLRDRMNEMVYRDFRIRIKHDHEREVSSEIVGGQETTSVELLECYQEEPQPEEPIEEPIG